MACQPAEGTNPGTGGSGGASGSSGGSGSGSPGGGGGSGSGAGTGGASGMAGGGSGGGGVGGGGSGGGGMSGGGSGGGGMGGGTFSCPTMPIPGNCTVPLDLRCPYQKLSQTGCIDANPFSDPKVPIKLASSVVPYEVNSPLWSDGAWKTRGMKLPAGGKIHVKDCAKNPDECKVNDFNTGQCCAPVADDGKWVYPAGTVMVKNFMFPDTSRPSGYKLVETRLLVHFDKVVQLEGVNTEWVGYGYQWDDAQTDATIVGTLVEGSDTNVSAMFNVKPTMGGATQSVTWNYPSRNDCITCHMPITPTTTPSGGFTIGPETAQMNRTVAGDTMNQIDKFAAMGMFDATLTKPYKAALVAPYPGQAGSPPAGATLDQRARSYLHANCSFCHRPDGKFQAFDVRYDIPFFKTGLCGTPPGKGDLGVMDALLVTPKDPSKSLVWLRMHAPKGDMTTGETGRMPQIGSYVVDMQGTQLISDWITSITACPTM
ncbi:MAG TPA: hypothetical protein VHL80_02010 [Polyangia bacterium]|nr:hypothetical protein [Polyangia bacterium]